MFLIPTCSLNRINIIFGVRASIEYANGISMLINSSEEKPSHVVLQTRVSTQVRSSSSFWEAGGVEVATFEFQSTYTGSQAFLCNGLRLLPTTPGPHAPWVDLCSSVSLSHTRTISRSRRWWTWATPLSTIARTLAMHCTTPRNYKRHTVKKEEKVKLLLLSIMIGWLSKEVSEWLAIYKVEENCSLIICA